MHWVKGFKGMDNNTKADLLELGFNRVRLKDYELSESDYCMGWIKRARGDYYLIVGMPINGDYVYLKGKGKQKVKLNFGMVQDLGLSGLQDLIEEFC